MTQSNFLLLVGSDLFPPTNRALLASVSPRSQHSAQVPHAWLAFARPGVPYAEPTTPSVILQGVNDDGAPPAGSAAYGRWVWERCSPGMEWVGEGGGEVPWLEGVIYELSDEDWTRVYDRLGGSFVSVTVHAFEGGDHDKRVGTYKAWLPTPPQTRLIPGLTPSLRIHRSVFLGALLSTLSRPYLAHLSQFRSYAPSRLKRLYSRLLSLWLLPGFVVFFLPSRLLRRFAGVDLWTREGAVGRWVGGVGLWGMDMGERIGRLGVGSGWRNEVRGR